jgi:hypothetical protein
MGDDSKIGAFASILAGFQPVPKVFLLVGFLVFCFGVPAGFSLENRAMMIGVALFAGGIAGHYWPETTFGPVYTGDESSGGIRWGNVFLAVVFSAICVLAGWLAYLRH